MAIRAGMAALVAALRTLAAAGENDYTLGVTAYWSGDQLQDVLDAHRQTLTEPLTAHRDAGGETRRYSFEAREVEQAASGAEAWLLVDAAGNAVDVDDYTVNYAAREIVFAADTGGARFRLRCRSYALKRAAGEVWGAKAAHAADRFDVRTDNHDLKRSQLQAACLTMAKQLRDEAAREEMDAAPHHVRFIREDVW